MKKLLLIAAASATILSSAVSFAEMTDEFYIKAAAGAAFFDKIKVEELKLKAKAVPIFEVGVGYYVMDNVRADISFVAPVNPVFKKSGHLSINGRDVHAEGKKKSTVYALLVNGYVDLFDLGVAKVFAGGGVGASYVKTKTTVRYDIPGVLSGSLRAKEKRKYDFAWQLSLGASAEVAPGVKAELAYSYRDYGRSKSTHLDILGEDIRTGKARHKSNNVMVGVRFDI